MKKKLCASLLFLGCLVWFMPTGFAELQELKAEVLRSFERQTGEWASFLLVKDLEGREQRISVNEAETLVERGTQLMSLRDLTGGMKVTILYRKAEDEIHASFVRIDSGYHA